ncbi:hypothetical protein BC936DRAFT_141587 [Jimgerdemannia flammicorona]|uniref:Ubiquitin-like domain-containing protein n=1 Tax=Jimgerdemannia flammicorona TaxID=994334 RepID=A0A433DNK0_9FUNG|nr:hypothetical protein BC936DRAFT_141587 [Jimgerdemannia flammicorona]
MSGQLPLDLNIRFTEGEDVLVNAHLDETITQVKEKIKQTRPALQAKHLRLIYQGRVLADVQTLNQCNLSNPRFADAPVYLHCSLTDVVPGDSEATMPIRQCHFQRPQTFIYFSSYAHITRCGKRRQLQPQITPPTGFDRLREAGFSEDDIQNIRAQFHHLHGTVFNGGVP